MNARRVFIAAVIVLVCTLLPPLIASSMNREPTQRDLVIRARRYAFDPPRITVNKGDEIHIRLVSQDVLHGFYLEGHDIDAQVEPGKRSFQLRRPSREKEFHSAEEIVFTANRPGKFRYRCSHTCGSLHPFMQGELIVRPNLPYLAGIGGGVGVLLAAFMLLLANARDQRPEETDGGDV